MGIFISKPAVSDTVTHLDADVVVEVLSRHGVNVTDAAQELGVASMDLRRLLWAKPHLANAAVEMEERRLDRAERTITEALDSEDPRTRLAASMFVIRNSHRARRRGWVTSSSSVAELSISTPARPVVCRWRAEGEDPAIDAAAHAEAEERGEHLITVGWARPDDDKVIDHEAAPESAKKD